MADPIVVGVDGSASSLRAVAWAAREARLRGAPLRIVHVALRWAYDVPLVPQPENWGPEREAAAQELLRQAAKRARADAPAVTVTTEILDGAAAEAIAATAESAQLIVVGSRGRGGFAGLLLGSVSGALAARSPCPVVIVGRPQAGHGAEIVVGVTGHPDQDPVVRFAFEEAVLRRLPLRAVHAWTHPAVRGPGDMQPLVYDVEGIGQEEARLLAESLAGWRERFPDVTLAEHVKHEHPSKALSNASVSAALVVVGAPGRASFFGSTIHFLLHHTQAPVAVIPYAGADQVRRKGPWAGQKAC
ncbi:universal stress protein [Streptosporangium sp. NBC_01756]|uniref:universal stress protein n=1 Tax=Streptosporangium sp. NBC_01756 TaxID=2975950 RepID=UPI002DD9BCAC|nr:universal stress protein [Streptosporangium sp. NBC_01756]WSC86455.1 universal stress protein [Streptosporangium sp. NBC_01756]